MSIRYEVLVRSKVPGLPVMGSSRKSSDLIRDFISKSNSGPVTTGQALDRLTELLGRLCDHLQVNLLTVMKEKELNGQYRALTAQEPDL